MEAELTREKELENERESKGVHADLENLDMGFLERKDDVESMWEKGTEELVELGKFPSVLAKLERAGKAVEVVKAM